MAPLPGSGEQWRERVPLNGGVRQPLEAIVNAPGREPPVALHAAQSRHDLDIQVRRRVEGGVAQASCGGQPASGVSQEVYKN
jgi:hypothetical protein